MSAPGEVVIAENLGELYRTFQTYANLYSKGQLEASRKLAHNVSVFATQELKKNVPQKGEITRQNIERLKARKKGMWISKRAANLVANQFGPGANMTGKQKRLVDSVMKRSAVRGGWMQALRVAQELRLREGHRSFVASCMTFRKAMRGGVRFSILRGGQQGGMLTEEHKQSAGDSGALQIFVWDNGVSKWAGMGAHGMKNVPKNAQAISRGIERARQNMVEYIHKKHREYAAYASRFIRAAAA